MASKVFNAPNPSQAEIDVIGLIEQLRDDLKLRVHEPRRWVGTMRRMSEARAIQASNSIEGYNATLSDVVAAADGEEPMEANEATRHALAGYRDAMTYVLQISKDAAVAPADEGLLKSLHFMMLKHDLSKHPGRWRPGEIRVVNEAAREVVYEGPPAEDIPGLIDAMLDELSAPSTTPNLIRAAMAHLNLVMIHPFSDGNGRMARCVQTLVLAREQIIVPTFSSIEEYLGAHTPEYYAVLAEVGQGNWHPENNPRPWIRFCLTAHYIQARTQLQRIQEYEQLWVASSRLAEEHRLPDRVIGALGEAALGIRVRSATYRANVATTWGEDISELTASRDLRAIVTSGLFQPVGNTRARYYFASDRLKAEWNEIKSRRPARDDVDPFALVEESVQEPLFETSSAS
jgi:Fic family protein